MGVRRRGRGRWKRVQDVSYNVREFLCLSQYSKGSSNWVFKEGCEKKRASIKMAHLKSLAAKDEEIHVQRSKGLELKFLFPVDEKREVAESTYKRKLRKSVKEALAA